MSRLVLTLAASATALSTQRPDGVSGQALLVQQQLPPPKYGRPDDAEEWPPACTPDGYDKYHYAPPTTKTGRQGVACCASLIACVEERPLGFPGYGQPGMSKVVVCRASANMCPSVEPGEETSMREAAGAAALTTTTGSTGDALQAAQLLKGDHPSHGHPSHAHPSHAHAVIWLVFSLL